MILTVNSRPVSSVTPRAAWVDQASCADADSDLFFPGRLEGFRYDAARAICADCPVRTKCLEAAMAVEGNEGAFSRFGMYGGLTPRDRASLRHS